MNWNHTYTKSTISSEPEERSFFDLRALGGETRIDTDFGRIPARLLTDQHRLRVLTGGYRAIDWVEQLTLNAGLLAKHPELRPLRLPAGLFRPDVPRHDIVLSPNTLICARDTDPGVEWYGAAQDFAPVAHTPAPECDSITYVVIGCARPAMLRAEGMWVSC